MRRRRPSPGAGCRTAAGSPLARARPSGPASAATAACSPGSIQVSASRTYSGCAVSRSRSRYPAAAVSRSSSSICGQGRSGFTWSTVSGETPPQSSAPARTSSANSSGSDRFGGTWIRASRPSTTRAVATAARYSWNPASSAPRIAVRGFARKFCTMVSCTCPCRAAASRIASSDSARSRRLSPMPTRMPVVNGMRASPASSMTRSRSAGSLSGEPWCTWPGSAHSRSEVVSSIMPIEGAVGRSSSSSVRDITPGFRCGSSPVSASTSRAVAAT